MLRDLGHEENYPIILPSDASSLAQSQLAGNVVLATLAWIIVSMVVTASAHTMTGRRFYLRDFGHSEEPVMIAVTLALAFVLGVLVTEAQSPAA